MAADSSDVQVASSATTGLAYSMSKHRRQQLVAAYVFVLPAIVFFFGVRMISMGFAFYLSFTNWDILSPVKDIVGVSNYIKILTDPIFLTSLRNTAYYSLLIVAVGIPLALMLAVLIDSLAKPARLGVRFAFFVPLVTSTVAVVLIWTWIYQPVFGLANQILKTYLKPLGIPPQSWTLDPKLVIPCLAAMSIWKGVGYNMIIFSAGLQGIDPTYYEAARMDGANRWHLFRYITLPLLQPTTLVVFITTIIGSFQVFTQVYMMTSGGPGYASRVIGLDLYQMAFMNLKMGVAAAMAMVLFAIIFALTMLQLRIGRSYVEY